MQKDELNILYGKIYKHNQKLLKIPKSNYTSLDCSDIMDVHITSHALSYLRNLQIGLFGTHGLFFNARCIIEGIAVKKYCQSNNVDIELLKRQSAIFEYKNYSKLNDIVGLIVFPEVLKTDYAEAVDYYNKKLRLNFTESQIKKIIESNIPFVCNPYTNYKKIINDQLGKGYARIYGLLSLICHPSTNDACRHEVLNGLVLPTLYLIKDEYNSLPVGAFDFNKLFNISFFSPISKKLADLTVSECKLLSKIAIEIESYFGENYISNTLVTLLGLVNEMMIDIIMGLREQAKSKFKVYLDMVAVFDQVLKSDCLQEQIELINFHFESHIMNSVEKDYDTSAAYKAYLIIHPCGAAKDKFDSEFKKTTGYLIDENGKTKSLSKAVKDYISRFNKEQGQSIMLVYSESQMISHANGYMYFSNNGAWSDINGMQLWIDIALSDLMQTFLKIYKSAYDHGEKNYKPLVNLIRNNIKRLESISYEKQMLLQIPTQDLNSFI